MRDPDFNIEEPELDWDSPIGEKPWPLRLAIPAMFKSMGRVYMWLCTAAVSLYIIQLLLGINNGS